MVKYDHKLESISSETAKAILGKRAYIVDITAKCLASSEQSFELSIWTDCDNTKYIAIAQYFDDEKTRIAITIDIAIRKNPCTKATCISYEKETNKLLHSTKYYADWIIPSAKKLEAIIQHVFRTTQLERR